MIQCPEIEQVWQRSQVISREAAQNSLRSATLADATKAAPDVTSELPEVDVSIAEPVSVFPVKISLPFLTLRDHGIQLRHLFGQQSNVIIIPRLNKFENGFESLVNISI